MEVLNTLLLIFILLCAIAVSFTRDLLTSIILFMAQSIAMSIVWILLRAPDLAITEAAVGAGITTLLMFITLKKLHAIRFQGKDHDKEEE
ncbi:MAG: DUF4040 domain-containing protein [Clostridia bacterium]|nr:DUF4040 domain-containing protein [Clostridia bacterium]